MVYALAYKYAGLPADAEDIAQETFVRAARGLGGFREAALFTTWLYRITLNAAGEFCARRNRIPVLGFLGIAALALLLGWPFRDALVHEPDASQSEQILLSEFAQLFPGQLRAVVARDGNIRPVLSTSPSTWQQQPLVIRLQRGQDVIRVISFSGQRVELTLDGETLAIEALVTASDQVLLIVDDRATLDSDRNSYAGYDIESQLLGVAL